MAPGSLLVIITILFAAVAALVYGIVKKNYWLTVPGILFLLVVLTFVIQTYIYLAPFRTIRIEVPMMELHEEEGYEGNISCVLPKGKYMIFVDVTMPPSKHYQPNDMWTLVVSYELDVNNKKLRGSIKRPPMWLTFTAPSNKTKVKMKMSLQAPGSHADILEAKLVIETYQYL